MKHSFFLFCYSSLLLIGYSNPPLVKDTLLISDFTVNGLKLGVPIINAEKQLLLCDSIVPNFEDHGIVYYVFFEEDMIMSYNSKNDSTVTWIEVFSPIFYTKNGGRVTKNINEITEVLIEEMEQDVNTWYHYFLVEESGDLSTVLFINNAGVIEWIGLYSDL